MTLGPGYTAQDELNPHVNAMAPAGISMGSVTGVAGATGGLAPQNFCGKLLAGPSVDGLNQLSKTTGTSWAIVNGKVQVVPLTGYLPGAAVVLNAKSGLVGWPVNTTGGINATCLLNPAIRLRGLVQINNAEINTTGPAQGSGVPGFPNAVTNFPALNTVTQFATVTDDGFYRVMVIEYEGDTRGNPWYSHLTLLAADLSAPVGQQVPLILPVAPGTPT
jgi:hypothetical protein